MYAVSLLMEDMLKGIPIKVDTVRSYLGVAVAFVMDVPNGPPDPRYARLGRRVDFLESVLVYAESLEDEPNRREPLTPGMLRQADAPVPKSLSAFLRRSAAIHDWLRLGLHTGFSASEWVQDSSQDPRAHPPIQNRKGDLSAVCGRDFVFRDACGRDLATSWATLLYTESQVLVTYCVQKNGANGATVLFTRVLCSRTFCAVHAALHLQRQAKLLGYPPSLSLAVFALANGEPRYIGWAMVVSTLCALS